MISDRLQLGAEAVAAYIPRKVSHLVPILLLLAVPNALRAELETPQSYHCIGYNPERENFLTVGFSSTNPNEPTARNCPKDYAFISIGRGGGAFRSEEALPIEGNCCRMPEGVLLDRHTVAERTCPANSVASGAWMEGSEDWLPACLFPNPWKPRCQLNWNSKKKGLRCTFIDSERFQLGEEKDAFAFGWPRHLQHSILGTRIPQQSIPLAIRYAAGRRRTMDWAYDGCIGNPPGALFVQVVGKDCLDKRTRELQYRGLPGDPPAGTPVEMFPHCDAISDVLDPASRCLTAQKEE